MSNVNIVATRIDQRLLHGSATFFVRQHNGNLVIVANDSASEDKLQQSFMKVCLSNEIGLRFFSINHTVEIIQNAAPEQKIIIIAGNVGDVYHMVTHGVPIKDINIGNIHSRNDRKPINRFINLSDEELHQLRELKNKYGVSIWNSSLSTDVTNQPLNWNKILA